MAEVSKNWLHRRFRWSTVGVFVLVLCFSGIGMITVHQWQDLNQSDHILNASLISSTTADYSSRKPASQVSQVDPSLIEDMIRDSQPDPENLLARLELAKMVLNLPINEPLKNTLHSANLPITPKSINKQLPVYPSASSIPVILPTALAATIGPIELPNKQLSTPGPTVISTPKPDIKATIESKLPKMTELNPPKITVSKPPKITAPKPNKPNNGASEKPKKSNGASENPKKPESAPENPKKPESAPEKPKKK